MRIYRSADVPVRHVDSEGAAGLTYRGPVDAESFRLNYVEVAPGGSSRSHLHRWEQVNYVMAGSGHVRVDGENWSIQAGDWIRLEPGEDHCYVNTSRETLVLLGVLGPEAIDEEA